MLKPDQLVRVSITCRAGTKRMEENPLRWIDNYHTVTVGLMSLAEYLVFKEEQLRTNFLEVRNVSFEEVAA